MALLFAALLLAAATVETAYGQQAAPGNIVASAEPMAAGEGARVLTQDSGRVGGKQSLPGSGHSVRFELPTGQWYLVGIDFMATKYGQGGAQWQLSVCDAANNAIASMLEPYGAIETGDPRWYRVYVPALVLPSSDTPQQPARIQINLAFDCKKSVGVEVVHDVAKKASFSAVGMPDKPLSVTSKTFDWMIRAVITDKAPQGTEKYGTWLGGLQEMAYDNGKQEGGWGQQGVAAAVQFTDVPAGSHIEGFSVYGVRMDRVDPTRRRADYWVVDAAGAVIASGSVPYASFAENIGWVDVPLRTKIAAPAMFYFLLNPNLDSRGGIELAYDKKPVKSTHAKLASGPGKYREFGLPGDWMIRAYVRKPAPVVKPEAQGESAPDE